MILLYNFALNYSVFLYDLLKILSLPHGIVLVPNIIPLIYVQPVFMPLLHCVDDIDCNEYENENKISYSALYLQKILVPLKMAQIKIAQIYSLCLLFYLLFIVVHFSFLISFLLLLLTRVEYPGVWSCLGIHSRPVFIQLHIFAFSFDWWKLHTYIISCLLKVREELKINGILIEKNYCLCT